MVMGMKNAPTFPLSPNVNSKRYVSGCYMYNKVRLLEAGQLGLQRLPGSGEGEMPTEKSLIQWRKRGADMDTNPKI
jgi:hypothetical protein